MSMALTDAYQQPIVDGDRPSPRVTKELEEYSSILWKERDLLELLSYRLHVQDLVLRAGRSKMLTRATEEVDAIVSRLRVLELGRSVEAAAAARSLGLVSTATLRETAEAAPAPWDEILHGHLLGLRELTNDISTLSRQNRDSIAANLVTTQELLSTLRDDTNTYDHHGTAGGDGVYDSIIDTAI